jgi:hypothetical protein
MIKYFRVLDSDDEIFHVYADHTVSDMADQMMKSDDEIFHV